MVDIFVSYSSQDRERVKPLVSALERSGWSVWWDREIGAGAAFDRKIEQALDDARCVIVVWSKSAVDSEWVRAEAHEALERSVLVPVRLDDSRPPLAFRRLQTIALPDGEVGAETMSELGRAIGSFVTPRDTHPTDLVEGRAAYDRHEWEQAHRLLESCDAREPLAADDLERMAWAAFWTARFQDTVMLFERAEAEYRRCGDLRGVVRTCLHQVRMHNDQRHPAISEAIMNRVTEMLATAPECPEHGMHATFLAQRLSANGEFAEARALAERARDIGRRFGDLNVEAMALLWLGRTHLLAGNVADGVALHDAATTAATSGELDPYFSGFIYCQVISACRERADWERAAEWTERADRWSARESIGFFPGMCRIHRAEILRFRGALRDAERDVMRGCELLMDASPNLAPFGFRELAEIRYRLGDLAGAEAACREVMKLGAEPQPVLAWLKFLRGDTKNALAALERALTESHVWHRGNHPNLLPAKVTIALAAGNLEAASQASRDLDALAERLGTPTVAAAADRARGELDLAVGKSSTAIVHLRRAVMQFVEANAPFEAGQAQRLLATAYANEGDRDAALLELEIAQATFERLGAALDIEETENTRVRIAADR